MGELTDYIAGLADPVAATIERYRGRALTVVPQAEEGRSYGMPALRYRGRPLISVVAAKHGYSVFPFSATVVADVVARWEGFDSTKGGIKFTGERQLPDEAFDTLVKRRREEIDAASSPSRPR